MSERPTLLGILNITEDSFSDGGRYLAPQAALARARVLLSQGADILDLGAASSNPTAKPVMREVEIARLAPVIAEMKSKGAQVSVDSFAPEVQRWAMAQDVDYLNDIAGFPHPEIYADLARSRARLIVMHSLQGGPAAQRFSVPPDQILDKIMRFFDARLTVLERAGVNRARLIVDPGMGLFLGTCAEASYAVLRNIARLKTTFALPVLISVSRKSFLRRLTGRSPSEAGATSLAAELFAARQGADYIRTHDPAALRDALTVAAALDGQEPLA